MSDPIYVEVTTPAPIEVTVTEAVVVLPGGGGGGAVDSVEGRTGVVTLGDLFAAIVHAHVVSDVTGLQAALDAKQPAGSYAAAVHSHAQADVTGLVAALAGKAATSHSHAEADVTGLTAALAAKAPLASPAFTGTPTGITKTHVGLGNVDNTSDVNKPVSSATTTQLNLKAPLASPAFTGTPTGITKSHVGLGNVDNTSDAGKPVSTAQQTALDLKLDTSAAPELIRDTVGTALLGGAFTIVTPDDGGDTITIAAQTPAGYTDNPEATASRLDASSTITNVSQRLIFGMFTASQSRTVTNIRVVTGSTAAAATPTLCRLGLYSVASDGALTLIASTTNDSTLFAAATTVYDKALSASVGLTKGSRYAIAVLVVSGVAVPTFAGVLLLNAALASGMLPQLSGILAGQADLPSTVTAASYAGSTSGVLWAEVY